MRIDILSLFPEYFDSPLKSSILGRALNSAAVDVRVHQLRDYTLDRHRRVDDRSFGGGPGMVLMPQPLDAALQAIKTEKSHVVYLSPAGAPFNRKKAAELASRDHVILLCGHYEGIDQRIIDQHVDEELSVGDFVLTSGCSAALLVIDATIRFIPGVLGDEASREQDSFEGPFLDHPHYTTPREYCGSSVPEVLTSGDHAKIEQYRRALAYEATWSCRPDLASQWIELPASDPSQADSSETNALEADSSGVILATAHLAKYRKLLNKEMGLPWIDKSATMGALLLSRGEILLWERPDGIATQSTHVQIVAPVLAREGNTWRKAVRRLAERLAPLQVTMGSDWVCIQDPLGWRLLLKQQKKIESQVK